jgi:hypothetical protein
MTEEKLVTLAKALGEAGYELRGFRPLDWGIIELTIIPIEPPETPNDE